MNTETKQIAEKVRSILSNYQNDKRWLVSVLQDVQAEYNYLPVVGVSAIGLVNRGVNREMATPFYEHSEACIGCGACAYVCPTDAITVEDVGDTRIITIPSSRMEFKLKKCKTCGNYWAPERQLDYIVKKLDLAPEVFDNCPDCRG